MGTGRGISLEIFGKPNAERVSRRLSPLVTPTRMSNGVE
jgi:hypothetical protein